MFPGWWKSDNLVISSKRVGCLIVQCDVNRLCFTYHFLIPSLYGSFLSIFLNDLCLCFFWHFKMPNRHVALEKSGCASKLIFTPFPVC